MLHCKVRTLVARSTVATWQAGCSQTSHYSRKYYWKCVSSCEAHVVVPLGQSSSAMRGRGPAVSERDLWPPRSPDLNPPYLLLCRELKEEACTAHLIARDDFAAIIEYIIACSRLYYAAHWYLPWNRWRPLQKPTAITRQPLKDHRMPCAIWRWLLWKLHISEHILCNSCEFLTGNHILGACGKISLHPIHRRRKGRTWQTNLKGGGW
jgi:hypothetical protein